MMRKTSILAAAFTIGAALSVTAEAETVKITLLGVGDVYKFEGNKTRGGPARLNAVAKAERAANPNFIYAFDGDMISPSLLSSLDKGENMIALTNLVPFDLAVPGNHEFDVGKENFVLRAKQSKYPWAAVNITNADGSNFAGLGGVMVKDIQGVKVALVPIAQDTSPEVANTGDLKFANGVTSGVAAAQKARKDGADIVVAVSQTPRSQDALLIDSKAFDVILSGDDHELAMEYNGITAYIETSIDANYLVPVDLTINVEVKDGKRSVKWEPGFRFIDTATVKPDAETQTLVDGYNAELNKELNVVIGKTVGPLDSRRNMVRKQETAIGNFIADAMKGAVGADIAITNGGGIRGDKEYAAGADITRKDILTELPYGNVTVLTTVSGQQVHDALENGFSKFADGAGRFPQVAGMKVIADVKKPAGSRVISVMIGDKPLDPKADYKLATNDYMLDGGDGYTALKGGKVTINGGNAKLVANDVLVLVKNRGNIDAKVEGRITIQQ
ncbi:MAG: bifunctional metallophosphatase/5'-nucleotidase [Alphaproteobacteria bacterium]|nr:bifunctional metallophosphatase/5'-nucleotidase [Alphaproteobacteria bacterium]